MEWIGVRGVVGYDCCSCTSTIKWTQSSKALLSCRILEKDEIKYNFSNFLEGTKHGLSFQEMILAVEQECFLYFDWKKLFL